MSAFIDEDIEHFPYQFICSVYLHWECCVVRVFHASQFWCWRNKSPCAVGVRRCFLNTLFWELILPHAISSGHYWNILLSIRLSVLDFWSWNGSPAVSSGYLHFCSFIGIHRIDQRDPKLREDVSSFFCSPSTRHGVAFTVGEPSFEVVFWPVFVMALCFPRCSSERKSLIWLQGYIDELEMLNKQRRWFHSFLEKLLLGRMLACWFLVSTRLLWIVLVQVDTFS